MNYISDTVLNRKIHMGSKGARLKALRSHFGESQSDFGARFGVNQGNVAKYENDKQPFGSSVDFRIVNVFNLNPHWWETGEGPMFAEKPNAVQEGAAMYQSMGPRGIISYIPEQLVKVPLIEVNARAGFVENLENYQEYISEYAYVLPERGVKYDRAIAISIDGDSMEPRLQRGDKVLAFFQDNAEWEYLNPGVYAVVYRSSFVIKRIVKNTLQTTGTLELISDNHEMHGPITVRLEDIRAIWKIAELIKRRIY